MTAFPRTVQSVGGKLVPFIIKISQVATTTSLSESDLQERLTAVCEDAELSVLDNQ